MRETLRKQGDETGASERGGFAGEALRGPNFEVKPRGLIAARAGPLRQADDAATQRWIEDYVPAKRCLYGSGFGLNGVMSSSSRHTTRFLNFQPCEVFTRVSS